MKKLILAAPLLAGPAGARTIPFAGNSFSKPQPHALQQLARDRLAASNQPGQ